MPHSQRFSGPGLRELMDEASCSNAKLARKVNELAARQGVVTRYDKSSVTRWLSGMHPRGRTPEFIAAALANFLGRQVSLAELGYAAAPQHSAASRALAYREDVGETLRTLADLGSAELSRRDLMAAVSFVPAALMEPQREWLLWLVEDQPATLAVVEADGEVAQVQAMVAMFDEMDNRFGGMGVRSSIVHYLSAVVVPMLHRYGSPTAERRQLYTAGAKLAATAGWSLYDSGEYGLAQRYMIQALRLCAEGENRVLGGQILAGLSHLATNLGHPREGVAAARTGIATAKHSGSPLGLMRLHAMAARAYAALGQPDEATASLRAAEAALEASSGADSESPWVRYLDHHYLEAEAALCHRDLGEAKASERLAAASVAANADKGRRRAISQSVLATSLLQQKRLDEALSTAGQALTELSGVQSQRSVQALRHFRSHLAPHRRMPEVREFERRAAAVLGPAA
jgi:tetratricopeptide (TPR) repeat protein